MEVHKQLDLADQEHASIKKIFDLANGPADYNKRMKTAANFRSDIEGLFNAVNDCNNIIQQILPEDKKKEMTDQVCTREKGISKAFIDIFKENRSYILKVSVDKEALLDNMRDGYITG